MSQKLPGKRILIVEDNPILAYDISDLVGDIGAEAVGPALDLETGLRLLEETTPDAALLDVDLGGEYVWPLAAELDRKAIPYAFVSAQCRSDLLPDSFKERRCIEKPALPEEIIETLMQFAGQPKA